MMQPGGSVFVWRLIALFVVAGVITLALWMHHRRKSRELIVARYHLRGDALRWRRVSFVGRKEVRICSDCGAPVPDYKSQEKHISHHEVIDTLSDRLFQAEKLVAELLGGKQVEPVKEPPWTAVLEDSIAPPPVTEHEPAPQIEEEEPRFARFREAMERINATPAS